MRIKHIEITGFRNLRSVNLEIPHEGSFVVGMNGQGKTNFLEAIYYLGTLKSFRSSKDTELVYFDAAHFRIVGRYRGNRGEGKIETAYDKKRKIVKINDVKEERISDAFGTLKVVLMTPDDVEMIQSHPSRRRRFIDIVLSMTSKNYLHDLTRYQAALRQRNTLLKNRGVKRSDVEVWDSQMCKLAVDIVVRRSKFTDEFSAFYKESNSKLAGSPESTLCYVTSPKKAVTILRDEGEKHLENFYEAAFKNNHERDRELGVTTVGPHRDDLAIGLGERTMRSYGSQGQQRTSVFAMRMAEARYIEERTGERPILLMDDVFSQLDLKRGNKLMELVYDTHQTLISTPRKGDTGFARQGMGMLLVKGGEITPENQQGTTPSNTPRDVA